MSYLKFKFFLFKYLELVNIFFILFQPVFISCLLWSINVQREITHTQLYDNHFPVLKFKNISMVVILCTIQTLNRTQSVMQTFLYIKCKNLL